MLFKLMDNVVTAGVLEVAIAMVEVGERQQLAAKDAVAARRKLQEEAVQGTVLPSGVSRLYHRVS